ncbi:MAG: histidine phosphatase family protein [Acidimicrobiia bacterium]|nr:histidine phosphatase family protein [Acidimicrobiia bacterium]
MIRKKETEAPAQQQQTEIHLIETTEVHGATLQVAGRSGGYGWTVEIVLVRHGEPEWVRDGLNVDNPPLTERGHRQAEAVARALTSEHFDEIWVSPLVRAHQTAQPLLRDRGIQDLGSVTQHWLEEIRNPLWHGTPREKADAAYAEERSRESHRRWDGLTGGESVREFVSRIHAGAGAFLAERGAVPLESSLPVWRFEAEHRKILLVAHAGTNSVLICHLLGLQPTPWEWERFVIGHASISRLHSHEMGDGHTFGLARLSDLEHLDASERTY